MQNQEMLHAVLECLNDLKAQSVVPLDVRPLTSITEYMIISTGSSSRHVKAIADNLIQKMEEHGILILGIESDTINEWILVDLGDVVVHIMQQKTREFYNLEKLWGFSTRHEAAIA